MLQRLAQWSRRAHEVVRQGSSCQVAQPGRFSGSRRRESAASIVTLASSIEGSLAPGPPCDGIALIRSFLSTDPVAQAVDNPVEKVGRQRSDWVCGTC